VNRKWFLNFMTLMLMLGLTLAACAPQATATPETVVATSIATEPPPTEVPTAEPSPTSPPAPTDQAAPEPIVLVDGLDRTVTLQSPAQRHRRRRPGCGA
jgi:ABC-type Fe3+-hydroxamate transport system substrate-binding protein